MVMTAGRDILKEMNSKLPTEQQVKMKLSKGWLHRFQKRYKLRSLQSYGESGDAPAAVVNDAIAPLREILEPYSLNDCFNADEFGLFYKMAPTHTIALQRLPGRKKEKTRLTFLACANASGSERFPMLVLGHSRRPRCFKGKSGEELGFFYRHNKKAWMNGALFLEWLGKFSDFIANSPGRKVVLLIDNASSHGTAEMHSSFQNVKVVFLPPNTTSMLQPLDAGIIAAIKRRYRSLQCEGALDSIKAGVRTEKIYCVDQLTAMRRVENIWQTMPSSIFFNSWRHTKLVYGSLDAVIDEEGEGIERQTGSTLQDLISPSDLSRISLSNLLNPVGEDVVEEMLSIEDLGEIAADVLREDSEMASAESDDEGYPMDCISYADREKALAIAKLLVQREFGGDCAALGPLRVLQRRLRSQRIDSMSQTRITNFFGSTSGSQ